MPKGEITKLYRFLFSNENYGMVFPIVLRPTIGNERVNNFGNAIDKKTMRMIDQNHNMLISSLPDMLICDTGPGGCNISKLFFYNKVGLQDEKMFMYSDEVEMGIRAKKVGVTMAVTKNAVAWHMHINQKGKTTRSTFVPFLIARNKIYVAKKHFGRKELLTTYCHWLKVAVIGIFSSIIHRKGIDSIIYYYSYLKGLWAGITNNMKNNF
jgi:GT2 family glycosyltransferase